MKEKTAVIHTALFVAFLAFVIAFIISPSLTAMASGRGEPPTGLSVAAVVFGLAFPIAAITGFVVVQAYKSIKRARE
jgi:hypothetical protein